MEVMSLFPDEDVLTREISKWRSFIGKILSEDDKLVSTKLLNDCYKYAVATSCRVSDYSFVIDSK
jgi:hypothetical protein